MDVLKSITSLMNKKNLGVNELADLSGVSSSTISFCMRGLVDTKYSNVEKILKALGYELKIVRIKKNAKQSGTDGDNPESID